MLHENSEVLYFEDNKSKVATIKYLYDKYNFEHNLFDIYVPTIKVDDLKIKYRKVSKVIASESPVTIDYYKVKNCKNISCDLNTKFITKIDPVSISMIPLVGMDVLVTKANSTILKDWELKLWDVSFIGTLPIDSTPSTYYSYGLEFDEDCFYNAMEFFIKD
jgi:hypothetical protein